MPYRKQTRAEPDHVNITNYNTLTFIKIDASTKKTNSILANSEEFSGQLGHVNTLLHRKALIFFKVPV